MFRSIPNTYTFRPADLVETAACYSVALNTNRPSVFALTRQDLDPVESSFEKAKLGAYIIKDTENTPNAILIATGSEVNTALEVAKELEELGQSIRVVSMPCMELFDAQPDSYKEKVLDRIIPTFAIELSSDLSFYKYISTGTVIGTTTFGMSGTPTDVIKELKLDTKSIVNQLKKQLKIKEKKD